MIKFSASRLEKEPIELSGEEKPEFLGMAEDPVFTAKSPVRYELKITHVAGGAVVVGKVQTRLESVCGRCLTPVTIPLEAPEVKLYRDLSEYGDEVDLSEDLRDELLLNLPMNPLCSEDCRGLCPECGADWNRTECECKKDSGSPVWGELDKLNLKETGKK